MITVGYEFNQGKTEYDVFIKAGVLREFSGRGHYHLNNKREDHYFRSNWVNTAIGLNARINQKHVFHGKVDTDFGNKFNAFKFNLGYRYIF